jgi:predicted lysophospholipase L1 biosynthesis ABC-type transport system permease subunit
VRSAVPEPWILDVSTAGDSVRQQTQRERLAATLFGWFAVLGLALCLGGVYALVSYATAARLHECGVRLALGARPRQLVRILVFRGIRPVVAGAVVGLALAAGTSRVIQAWLFGVEPLDPATYLMCSLLIVTVAAGTSVAAAWPVRRVPVSLLLREL